MASQTRPPPELAEFRQLLRQLSTKLESLEGWVQDVHHENVRLHHSSSLHHSSTGTALPKIAESPAEIVKLHSGHLADALPLRLPSDDKVDNHIVDERAATVHMQFESHPEASLNVGINSISAPGLFFESLDEYVRISELKAWFQKLLAKEPGRLECPALSPQGIQSLFRETDGHWTKDDQWISQVINDFNRAVSALPAGAKLRLQLSATASRNLAPHVMENMLSFDAFVELMVWKGVEEHLGPQQKSHALEIRDMLIKHSVDELIFEFSGMAPPKKKQTEREPKWKHAIEPIVGCVVIMNAITIGIGSDNPWYGWDVLEAIYTIFFAIEIFVKLYVEGFREWLCGPSREWNWFDMFVVSLAVFDYAISQYGKGARTTLSDLTIMRLARMAKITRLLRLLRFVRLRFFKELLLLLKGVAAGMRTLVWAFVLLATLVYLIAVVMRQTVGEHNIKVNEYDTPLFHSVPWSALIIFRCFIGDCALPDGTPLVPHLYDHYGFAFVLPYSVVTLFVTFGIFNLIMAVFVENVQENARSKRQLTRESERARVVTLMRELVMMFGGKKTDSEAGARGVQFALGGIITKPMFNEVLVDRRFHDILDELEVF